MKTKKASKRILLLIAAGIIICILILIFKSPPKTIYAKYSIYEDSVNFKGFYFVEEHVVYKGSIDNRDLFFKEGELVPKGDKITDDITATYAGMIVFNTDGIENKYNLKNIKNITKKDFDDILENSKPSPGVKIVNNSEWYICACIDGSESKFFKKGMVRDISVNGRYYTSEIVNTFSGSKEGFLVLRVKNDLDVLNLDRGFKGNIVKSRYKGIVIPKKSVIEYNGNSGVFINIAGYSEFRKVKILILDDEIAVVIPESTGTQLKEYDSIICNPEGLEDGSRIK